MPQTREEVLDHIDKLLEDHATSVHQEIKKFLASGAVDLEEWDNNYALPKTLYIQALLNIARDWSMHRLSRREQRTLKNLRRFSSI